MLKLSKHASIPQCVRMANQVYVEGFTFSATGELRNGKPVPAHYRVHCVGESTQDAAGKPLPKPTFQGRWLEKIDPVEIPGHNPAADPEATKALIETHLWSTRWQKSAKDSVGNAGIEVVK
jgi:hypothetical protein